MIEGLPAGVHISADDIVSTLTRRRLGHGRGARMKFEQSEIRLLTGVRHDLTLDSPVAIEITDTEWPKWTEVMSADTLDHDPPRKDCNTPLSRPRLGHADLTGIRKYGFDDARPILECSSTRETASRVTLGEVTRQFLNQAFDIRTITHVVALGGMQTNPDLPLPTPDDLEAFDASPVHTLDKEAETRIIERINEARKASDTLDGVIEVLAYGVPVGINMYMESDHRLDAALTSMIVGIQTFKGIEINDGFLETSRPGSQAYDKIMVNADGRIDRLSDRTGGIEGGMSNGQAIRVRGAMKPIPPIPKALHAVDVLTGKFAQVINRRSDSTAVPAASVVAKAMVRLTLAKYMLNKSGEDSVTEA